MAFNDAPPDGYLSDAPPDGFEDDGGGQSASTPQQSGAMDTIMQAAKQGGQTALAALNPVQTLKQAPDLANRVMNFQQGQPNTPATGILEAAANRPDVTAVAAASLIPGIGIAPSAARIGATAGASALSPENRGTNAAFGGGLQALFEALPYGAGKVAPAIRSLASKLSGTEAEGLKKLFDHPSLLFTGPGRAEAQQAYATAARKAGLSPEVSDDVLFGARKRFVKDITKALQANDEIPTQSLLDARQTVDDLIAAAKRKGEKNIVRGFVQKREQIQQQLVAQAPELRPADQTWSNFKTREQFLGLLPKNKAGDVSLTKTAILAALAGGGSYTANPAAGVAAGLAGAPLAQGLAASALGMASRSKPAMSAGLQAIRQYLMGQQQNGPASR